MKQQFAEMQNRMQGNGTTTEEEKVRPKTSSGPAPKGAKEDYIDFEEVK